MRKYFNVLPTKFITLILCVLYGITSFGQGFELRAYAGASSINIPDIQEQIEGMKLKYTSSTINTEGPINGTYMESFQVETGIEAGFEAAYFINMNLSIESAIGINHVEFTRKTPNHSDLYMIFPSEFYPISNETFYWSNISNNGNGIIIVDSESDLPYWLHDDSYKNPDFGQSEITYLTIPFRLCYAFFDKRLTIKAGLNTSIPVYTSTNEIPFLLKENSPLVSEYLKVEPDKVFNSLLLSSNVQLELRLIKTLNAYFGYYRSFNDLYNTRYRACANTSLNQLSVGIKYKIFEF